MIISRNDYFAFRLIIGGDYSKLKSDGYVPRKGVEPIPLSLPMTWVSKDRNIQFTLQAWRFMSPAWAYYVKNPSDSVAKEVFLFNINYVKDWLTYINKNKNKNIHAWYDMAVGIRAMHLAFMTFILKHHLISNFDEEKKLIKSLSLLHIEWLLCQKNITHGNHAIYQILGLRLLLWQNDLTEGVDYADQNMLKIIDASFDCNCVGTENSPFYHQYNIDILKALPIFLFPGIKKRVEDILLNAPVITKWLTAPNGSFYRIGDTEGDGVSLSPHDLLKDGFSAESSVIFKDLTAYQIVRSHPTNKKEKFFSLVLRGASSSYVHAHCDALSFIFFQDGREVFADPGKFTYEYGVDRDWFISDASHNTAGLKGKPFYPKDIDHGAIDIFPIRENSGKFILSGQITKSSLFFHKRIIDFFPGNYLVVTDWIDNKTKLNSEIRYVLGLDFRYSGGLHGYIINKDGLSYSIHFDGDIDSVESLDADSCKAWVSTTYANKKSTHIILINCLPGISRVQMKMHLLSE